LIKGAEDKLVVEGGPGAPLQSLKPTIGMGAGESGTQRLLRHRRDVDASRASQFSQVIRQIHIHTSHAHNVHASGLGTAAAQGMETAIGSSSIMVPV
jgi:hypothetical protein